MRNCTFQLKTLVFNMLEQCLCTWRQVHDLGFSKRRLPPLCYLTTYKKEMNFHFFSKTYIYFLIFLLFFSSIETSLDQMPMKDFQLTKTEGFPLCSPWSGTPQDSKLIAHLYHVARKNRGAWGKRWKYTWVDEILDLNKYKFSKSIKIRDFCSRLWHLLDRSSFQSTRKVSEIQVQVTQKSKYKYEYHQKLLKYVLEYHKYSSTSDL